MLNEITINSGERISDKTYVCPDCLILLTLRGALKDSFILKVESEDMVQCDICESEASFVVIPIERGIWVCDECLNERGKKNVWNDFEVVNENNEEHCDLCFKKGAKLIKPAIRGSIDFSTLKEGVRR
ncbi:MAG: hypothetical protein ACTSX9_02115 [Candidatus Njordarchaeales archaeon]